MIIKIIIIITIAIIKPLILMRGGRLKSQESEYCNHLTLLSLSIQKLFSAKKK